MLLLPIEINLQNEHRGVQEIPPLADPTSGGFPSLLELKWRDLGLECTLLHDFAELGFPLDGQVLLLHLLVQQQELWVGYQLALGGP